MSNLALPAGLTATLDDKYTRTSGRVFLTGTQALIRLPMLQRERDLAAGLNTAGFISGYRGSPLGNLDLGLWKAKAHLAEHHITFQPGINEDMAAWSSPAITSTPPYFDEPAALAWRKTSPQRSTPGPLPYHRPNTPSYLAPGNNPTC